MPGVANTTTTCPPGQDCGFPFQWRDVGSPTEFMFCMVGICACLAWLIQSYYEAARSKAQED